MSTRGTMIRVLKPGPARVRREHRRAAVLPGTRSVRRLLGEMVHRIVGRFQPQRIVLFGSHARGAAGPDSDIDLLVVMPVNGSKRRLQLQIRIALHDIHFPKDIIVVTPEEWKSLRDVPGTIVRPAWLEGRTLYQKD